MAARSTTPKHFSSKSLEVSAQAPWVTNKPDPNPKQQVIQEATQEVTELAVPHKSRPSISFPSWASLVCRPASLALSTHLRIPSGLGFASVIPTVQNWQEEQQNMKENNLRSVSPTGSQFVQVGVYLTITTASQAIDCKVRTQGSSYVSQKR